MKAASAFPPARSRSPAAQSRTPPTARALGTTAVLTDDVGGVGSSPATRSFVLSGVGDTPDSMIVLNANWHIRGPISGNGGLMLNGWSRNDAGGAPNIIGSELSELRLGGTNTYAGKTTVNFGTLVALGGSAIPNTSQVEFSTRSEWGVDAAPAANKRTFNVATLRVDASETVGSLAGGNATRGTVNINGAAVRADHRYRQLNQHVQRHNHRRWRSL